MPIVELVAAFLSLNGNYLYNKHPYLNLVIQKEHVCKNYLHEFA